MPGVEGQLAAHLSIGMNTGLTKAQLDKCLIRSKKTSAGSRLKQRANHWLKSSLPTKTNSNEQIHHRVFSLDNDAYELRRGFRAAKRYVGAYFGIEIVPEYLDEYQNHLERRISSFGDIGVGRDRYFPAAWKGSPTQIRILEIYAGREAYQSHLRTPHFEKYKTTTLKMVKITKTDWHGSNRCWDDD